MSNLWSTLVPLVIGSALVPIQIIITILLLRSEAGKRTAVAFVLGMTVVRLLQGVVFGLVLSADSVAAADSDDTSLVTASVLLVLGVVFVVMAARQLLHDQDPDAPPPKWLTTTATMGPGKAFLIGAGLLAIGVKFWVFTLGAVSAIGDAGLGRSQSIVTFLAFVALAESIHLVVLAMSLVLPGRSDATLRLASAWLQRHNRVIVIVLGFVFGAWFVLKGLRGLGVL